ncbi:MAG: 30S ribosomal protein S9 [bacterium]
MADKTKKKYWEGIGRRKTSSARVRIYEGSTSSTVNGKPLEVLYPEEIDQDVVLKPFVVTGTKSKMYFTAKVKGGGKSGQRDSISLGIARALAKISESNSISLKKESLLTRDPREVQRKKYSFVKSRKKPQFSKR